MKVLYPVIGLLSVAMFFPFSAVAQEVYKPRPDAFPPAVEPTPKAVTMAKTVDEMAAWDRYPTYETYLAMMSRWTEEFPTLCHVDTIGISIQGRLILSMYIEPQTDDDLYRPEFFYSSTIHGDEVTGYVMMLRLIDTLLHGYGTNEQYTRIINTTRISINPLSNPDGTYRGGNNTVQGAWRYNANFVDLNRTYPNPFNPAKSEVPHENQLMIDYMSAHQFRLSANLHGGAEVANYPWDSFTSAQNPHPAADWWQQVCRRFVDTLRVYAPNRFRDVTSSGYVAGGDWYVITGGRQDYMNYYHNCLELTLEISTQKTLSSDRLPEYWSFLQPSLVNYIDEIHSLPESSGIEDSPLSTLQSPLTVYPNPTAGLLTIEASGIAILYSLDGCVVKKQILGGECTVFDISSLPSGMYFLSVGDRKKMILKL